MTNRNKHCNLSEVKIIYLDQFAVSKMAKEKDDSSSLWRKIYDLLLDLVDNKIVVCPTSGLHREEGVKKPELINGLKEVCSNVSGGIEFISHMDVQIAQILEYAIIWLDNLEKEVSLKPSLVLEKSDPSDWRIAYKVSQINLGVIQRGLNDYEQIYKRWEQEEKGFDEYFKEEFGGFLTSPYAPWVVPFRRAGISSISIKTA